MSETNILVPEDSLSTADCKGLAEVLASVGDKWTIMVVGALSKGSLRYNEIQRRVSGISQRMLTMTLKRLKADGIVTRTLFPSVPPRVDYELTQLGQTLRGALVPLHLWAAKNKETIATNRIHAAAKGKHIRLTGKPGEMAVTHSTNDSNAFEGVLRFRQMTEGKIKSTKNSSQAVSRHVTSA